MTLEVLDVSMGTVEELKEMVMKQEEAINQMNSLLIDKEEEIRQLRSLLDKYQSVFPVMSPNRYSRSARRKERAQGISAEPQSLRTIQELIQAKFPEYPKSDSLYASPAQIAKGEMVSLASVYCFGMQVYLAVDTTAPLPKKTRRAPPAENPVKASTPPVLPAAQSSAAPEKQKLLFSEEDSLGPIPEWLRMELANAVSSASITKNVTTTGIGNTQESHQNIHPDNKYKNNQNTQHIKVKPVFSPSGKVPTDPYRSINQDNYEKSQNGMYNEKGLPLKNGRTAELENEILKLKEELKKYQDSNKISRLDDELEYIDEDIIGRPSSKKSFWSRRGSPTSKSKQRSRICSLQ